jgi:hypothetical protein
MYLTTLELGQRPPQIYGRQARAHDTLRPVSPSPRSVQRHALMSRPWAAACRAAAHALACLARKQPLRNEQLDDGNKACKMVDGA